VDVARPHAAVSPGIEGEALVVLARTTAPLTGRQIARLVRRGTSASVSAALDRLVRQGLVNREHAGSAYLHTLNREHVAAQIAELMAGLRSELVRRLRDTLKGWEPEPFHASMFGSAARGDGDSESDIDLLIIRPSHIDEENSVWREQIDHLSQAVYSWTGNHAGIIEVTEGDLATSSGAAARIVGELEADGIDLAGVPLRGLLRERE